MTDRTLKLILGTVAQLVAAGLMACSILAMNAMPAADLQLGTISEGAWLMLATCGIGAISFFAFHLQTLAWLSASR